MTAIARLCGLCLLAGAGVAGCARPFQPAPDATMSADAAALMQAGDASARRSDWQAAIAQYDQARKASPKSHLPLYGLATAYDRLGGRDLVAIAYYRAYLAALPLGRAEDVGLVLGRIDELDRRAADRVNEMVNQARRMADEIPPDIWWDRTVDREKLLRSLPGITAKVQARPTDWRARDSHRDRRGQPSDFATLEIKSWVAMAESLRADPSVSEPWTTLKAEAGKGPENAVQVVSVLARSQADALASLRDLERKWQEKWDIACPP